MNDRFKFRVWDKSDNDWFNEDDFTIYLEPNGRLQIIGTGVDGEDCFFNTEKVIVEQCTGLKDKNGKLIYENDLIKCPNGVYRIAVDDFGLWTAIYENNPFKDVVEWSDIVKNYAFNQENVEIEVIGNIHENPELLEVGGK